MKNRILIMVACLLCMLSLCACGNASEKKSIVCTVFPEYDWTREVLGNHADEFELTLLLDNGVDLHSYQPTAADIAKIAKCDVFVYVGGESDEWVEDALKESTNPNMQVINLLDVLGDAVKEEELVEGMQSEEEEEEEGEEEGPEYDEHVWLSLRDAQVLVNSIEGAIASVDSAHAADYEANAASYNEKLAALDGEYTKAVDSAKRKTVLFGDRFPYRYLVDDYGLTYYAAFVGCSAESEASFETVIFLANKVDELKLPYVMINQGASDSIAKAVIENTKDKNQKILEMNGIHSVLKEERDAGVTYLSIMQDNLEVLKKALN